MTDLPVGVGILSVPRRAIPPVGGSMGVVLANAFGPADVAVVPKELAESAGLKPNDVITHIDGKRMKNRQECRPRSTAIASAKRSR